MRSGSRTAWWVYGLAAAGLVVALGIVTGTVLDLERADVDARRDAEQREALRLALWRLDSWLGRELDREASRPVEGYVDSARLGAPALPGVRFELEGERWHSAAGGGVVPAAPEALGEASAVPELHRRLAHAEAALGAVAGLEHELVAQVRPADPVEQSRQELAWRARNTMPFTQLQANERPVSGGSASATGPMASFWWSETELCLVRRVRSDGAELLQGLLVDWRGLRDGLLDQITDLVPNAALLPASSANEASVDRLVTLPVRLEAAHPAARALGLGTPARLTLLGAWFAALAALLGAGLALRTSLAYAETRNRFARAVAHELRTPLTTFRMYAEMLSEGMVAEEERGEYLETLRRESNRLSALVEKALDYARLEEGRKPTQRRRLAALQLLQHVRSELEERARQSAHELAVESEGIEGLALETDPDVVGWILLQLVDNACKYAAGPEAGPLRLCASTARGRLELRLRDRGPGVPPGEARAIFRPFERAGDERPGGAQDAPGVGLGLALARGMARELGGDLRLEPSSGEGACFLLRL